MRNTTHIPFPPNPPEWGIRHWSYYTIEATLEDIENTLVEVRTKWDNTPTITKAAVVTGGAVAVAAGTAAVATACASAPISAPIAAAGGVAIGVGAAAATYATQM